MTKRPRVELSQVEMTYHTLEGETQALKDFSLQVHDREFISLVGPSGCGKSTVLSLIAGLLRPTGGRVLIDGTQVDGPSPKIGYMLQQDYLFEWRTILHNAALGLEIRGRKKGNWKVRVLELLSSYGLAEFAYRYPQHLSGGMRQRVALVRTLAADPDILLLDEPFSALDYQTRLHLEEEVGTILRREEKTVILVTHDIAEAISMSDKVVVMSRRPGRVKNVHEIEFARDHLTPLRTREHPSFREYFIKIWEEIDSHV